MHVTKQVTSVFVTFANVSVKLTHFHEMLHFRTKFKQETDAFSDKSRQSLSQCDIN